MAILDNEVDELVFCLLWIERAGLALALPERLASVQVALSMAGAVRVMLVLTRMMRCQVRTNIGRA